MICLLVYFRLCYLKVNVAIVCAGKSWIFYFTAGDSSRQIGTGWHHNTVAQLVWKKKKDCHCHRNKSTWRARASDTVNWSSGMLCSISHTWQLRLHCPYNDLIPLRHAKHTSSMYLACLHRMTPNDAFHKASDLLLCHQCFQILPKSHRGEWRLEFTFSTPPLQYCLPLNFPPVLIFKLTFFYM